MEQKSFSDVKKSYTISSDGKSNKEIVDAVKIWGGETFNDWNEVLQTTSEDKGVVVFRYGEKYSLMGNRCRVMVSVKIKPKNENNLSIRFSNLTQSGGADSCGWIHHDGVVSLSTSFKILSKQIQFAITDY